MSASPPLWAVYLFCVQRLHPAACKMQKLLDYTTGDSAIWCRVAFTVDRLVAVLLPLYVGRACGRPTSARFYAVAACVAAVAKNAHVLWTRGAEYRTAAVCANGSLTQQTLLVDVCGYPAEQYRVSTEHLSRPTSVYALVTSTRGVDHEGVGVS